jgi:hypothetical protein
MTRIKAPSSQSCSGFMKTISRVTCCNSDWMHLNLPSIATEDQEILLAKGLTYRRKQGDLLHPERESRATLEHIKTEIGSLQFSAQYQQQPIPLEGNIIRRRWFSTYDLLPAASHQTRVVQSWDVAMTTGSRNDYSVCTCPCRKLNLAGN